MLHSGPPRMRPLVLLAAFLALALTAFPASAQPLNSFVEIHSPDPTAYDMYQLKFTFLGMQSKNVTTLAVSGLGRAFDLTAFAPWEGGYDYSNDMFCGDTLSIAGPDWQFFMDSIMADPALQDTTRLVDPNVSLMIQTDMPIPMCWEHPATRADTDLLFQLLSDSVPDPAQKETIARFRRQMAGVRR